MQNILLDKMKGRTGKTYNIKKAFQVSLRDWFGAAEHILVEGNENLILCERGIITPHTHKITSRFMRYTSNRGCKMSLQLFQLYPTIMNLLSVIRKISLGISCRRL